MNDCSPIKSAWNSHSYRRTCNVNSNARTVSCQLAHSLTRERETVQFALSPLSSPRSNPRTLLPISRSVAVSGFGRTYDSLRKTEKKNKCVAVAAVVVVGRSLKKNGSVAVVRRWRREGRRRQEEGISWKTRDLLRDSLFLLFFLFCARVLSRFYCSVSQFPEENPRKKNGVSVATRENCCNFVFENKKKEIFAISSSSLCFYKPYRLILIRETQD